MQEQKTKLFSKIFLTGVFLLMIFAVPVATMFTEKSELSSDEKRMLAQMPVFQLDRKILEEFPKRFEVYYDDHFAFRKPLIFLHNYIQVLWFGKSPVSSIILGKNDWLYYTGNDAIPDYRGLISLSPLQLEAIKTDLKEKQDWLARQGIQYLFVIVPSKRSIYPEYMPEQTNRVGGKTKLDQIVDYLNTDNNVHFLDLRKPLFEGKKQALVYSRTDSHWTHKGAYIAYRNIIERISEWFPEEKSLNRMRFSENIIDKKGGNLAKICGLQDILKEREERLELSSPCARKLETGELANTGLKFPESFWRKNFIMDCPASKLRAVVFRDSFYNLLSPIISEHFSKTVSIWSRFDYSVMETLLEEFRPDIVIEERVEGTIADIARPAEVLHSIRGNIHIRAGAPEKAVEEYRKALEINPKLIQAHNGLIKALVELKKETGSLIRSR